MAKDILSLDDVVKLWTIRSIDHFHFAFDVKDPDWRYYESYFNYLGFEVLCKSVVIVNEWPSYEKRNNQQITESVNFSMKRLCHQSKLLVDGLKRVLGETQVAELMGRVYVSVSGQDIIDNVFPKIVQECRYLIPEPSYLSFPIEGGVYHDPLGSSDVRDFTYSVARMTLDYLFKKGFRGLTKDDLKTHILKKDSGERFLRIFFQ